VAVVQPAVVVVAAPPPPPVRQRIVVFNFVVNAQPGLVPPAVGEWAADQFASYWGRGYDVVERGEVCWYMGRLNLTMRDVLADDGARRCLAQALNVRYMMFGAIEQTNSFNVSAHMVDAETGGHVGMGMIHVQDHDELNLRMHELARQTGAPPAEQARLAEQGKASEKALVEARLLLKAGDHARAAEVARAALKVSPDVVALQIVLNEAEQQAKRAQLEAAARQEAARRAAEAEATRRRLAELTAAAEAARARAAEEAKNRGEAARKLQEQEKQRAFARLEAQGRAALAAGHYPEAIASLQSAVAIRANDDAFRELARAKAGAEAAEQARAAEEKRQREQAEQRRREEAQARVQQEKARFQAEEAARQARRERDIAEANHLTDQARQALAQQDFAVALAAATSAARLHDDPATHALVQKVRQEQELADARKKGEQARVEAERKLAEEKARHEKAEADLRQKQEAYNATLGRAQKALGERHYDAAVADFQEALKLYRTDAALNGLRQAEQARDHEKALAEAEQRRKSEEAQKAARLKELTDAGRRALEAKQFDRAVQSFRDASKLAPSDVDVRALLAKAEQWREQAKDAEIAAARQRDQEARAEKVRPYVTAARRAIAAKDYDTAAKALGEANKIEPGEPSVLKAAQELTVARQSRATEDKAQKQRLADYELAMDAGRSAERAKNLAGAVNAYTEALRIVPNDPAAGKALRDARAALDAAKAPPKPVAAAPPPPPPVPAPMPTPPPKSAPPAPNPAAEFARRMQQGSELDKQKRYAEAAASYREALKFAPGDAKATEALRVAEFTQHLGEASRLHAAKKFADAAREYEEALKRSPNDAAIKKLLQKAKENKLP
jgi:tetratricopeptide (TPR) repeat protein